MRETIQSLPWQIQVTLVCGYAAYLVAYMGIRFSHTTADTIFLSLAFGLLANGAMWLMRGIAPVYSVPAAFFITIAGAVAWRHLIRDGINAALYRANVSWSNDDPSALATLSSNSKSRISQIAVQLDDGTWLRCDDTSKFADCPFAAPIIGPNGDIAFYLTHEDRTDGALHEMKTVRDAAYGDRITYVPAARIRRITLRHVA